MKREGRNKQCFICTNKSQLGHPSWFAGQSEFGSQTASHVESWKRRNSCSAICPWLTWSWSQFFQLVTGIMKTPLINGLMHWPLASKPPMKGTWLVHDTSCSSAVLEHAYRLDKKLSGGTSLCLVISTVVQQSSPDKVTSSHNAWSRIMCI